VSTLEERVEKLESDLKVVAQVVASVTDDTLRVCLVLQELSTGGYLPDLPWELGTALVDLQYAKRPGAKEVGGKPVELRVAELELQVQTLREAFRRRADDQQIG
jgi:hypothetical protein